MKQFRQGDIFLKQVNYLPNLEKEPICSAENNDLNKELGSHEIVLAYGEVTGHKHAIKDKNASLFREQQGNKIFLLVRKEVELNHEEHSTIILPIGNYEVVRQREYTPNEIRRVAD